MSLKAWTQVFTMALVMIMFGYVDIYAEKEIIFPEISALALGFWIMKRPSWSGSNVAIWASPTLAALTGVVLMRYVHLSPILLICGAFILVVLQLKLLHSTVYPSISAAILAIITHTTSWLYPFSVCLLMAIIVLGKIFLDALKQKSSPHHPAPQQQQKNRQDVLPQLIYWGKLVLGLLTVTLIASGTNCPFIIAPPLIVAFVELSNPGQALRQKPVKVLLLVVLSATLGAMWLYVITTVARGPLWLFSGLSLASVFLLYNGLQISFPPAAALALLPVLVPASALLMYPVHVLIGCSLFIFMSLFFFKSTAHSPAIDLESGETIPRTRG